MEYVTWGICVILYFHLCLCVSFYLCVSVFASLLMCMHASVQICEYVDHYYNVILAVLPDLQYYPNPLPQTLQNTTNAAALTRPED